ncbi:hypothetical protein DERF_010820 [Dermatophagoides farinae]|uniref:Uncharacterized protein n=1 Tax=Dermatophagoides farinae TaxID=6954 RepID=A0A922HR19_DERFA|nr:hypothetical protein DERF_010820 [Dermatophagoides farinae]
MNKRKIKILMFHYFVYPSLILSVVFDAIHFPVYYVPNLDNDYRIKQNRSYEEKKFKYCEIFERDCMITIDLKIFLSFYNWYSRNHSTIS